MKEAWREKRVLVTGADGFIGSHLVEALRNLGAQTNAFVQYNSWGSIGCLGNVEKRDGIEIFYGDVRDKATLRQAMNNVDVVFHLAALISVPYSHQSPESFVKTNVSGTLNVLQTALESNVAVFVHTSSSEVYGTPISFPMNEKHPLQSRSPYAASKIAGEKLVESFHYSYGMGTVIIRPFNTYGPRQSMRAIIPSIIAQSLLSQTIQLGNLDATRDFNFVLNIVDGFIKAASVPDSIGKIINLGSGRDVSIKVLVDIISGLMNKKVVIEQKADRIRQKNSGVDRLKADNSLAKDLLNWQPRFELEEGLKQTIEWYKKEKDSARPDACLV